MENYRHELDGLRALAMLGVLLFHLGITKFQSGFLGVDIFFVLSGYLITLQISRLQKSNSFSFIDFYIRRARRLLPTLFLVILVTLLVGVFLLSPKHLAAASQSGLYATISVANIHFWLSAGYFDLANVYKPFLHFWSLSVEEQFYLIWPVLIILSGKYFGMKLRLGFIAAVSSLSVLAYLAISRSSPDAAFYLMPFRIWEFGVGAIIALGNVRLGKGGSGSALATLFGVFLIAFSFLIGEAFGGFPVHYLLAVIGAGLVISAPLNLLSKAILSNPIATYLGKISYSFYLWHWPVIIYLNYYFNSDDMSYASMLVAIILSLVLSCLSNHFVESRFRKPWTKTLTLERVAVPAGLLAVTSSLIIFASHSWAQNGWPNRLSLEQRTITAASQERPNPNCKHHKAKEGKTKICIFGAQGNRVDIALIGDSHANALAAGLVLTLQEKNLTGAASSKGGMGPFMGADNYRNSGEFRGNRDDDFKALLDESPKYVILHARYAVYWTTELTKADKRDLRIFLVEAGTPYNNSVANAQKTFRSSLVKTVQAIQNNGSIPVIVGSVPNPGVNMVDCLSRPLIRDLTLAAKNCGGFTQAQSLERTAEVEQFLKTLAQNTGSIYVNSNPVFCKTGKEICDRARRNKLVYRDSNHLSLIGARILANNVMKEIERYETTHEIK